MDEKATLIDVSKCMACRGCQVACKQWNQLPAATTKNKGSYENPPELLPNTYTRITFKEMIIDGKLKWLFRKEQCLHCTKAPCVEMCPVSARSKDELGFTEIDREKCIGCGVCVNVCPYKVPRLDELRQGEKTKKVTSCSFCLDRVRNGLEPACNKTCPTDALIFGSRKELLRYAHDVMANSKVRLFLYGEREFNGTHMLYLLPEEPATYGLPKEGAVLSPFEAYALLEESLKSSPIRDEVLAVAALKYFGRVQV